MALLLGYDVGSSSIKATLMDSVTGKVLATATSPEKELEITAEKPGWAEQHPSVWWEHVKLATRKIADSRQKTEDRGQRTDYTLKDVEAIGISYQMHGLVVVDKNKQVLRPSIIWCDSRAVQIGQKAAAEIGEQKCLENLLNLPGNFTASKLKWVMENEPDVFSKIYKMMLPGDYIAMKMTGEIKTTPSGLSEGIMWDFKKQGLANLVLDYYGIPEELIAEVVPTFSVQGELTKEAAEELDLKAGTKISYRAGDQPNNALSLNVLNPGEIAATAGTSGVVYGITEKSDYDSKSRVNTFIHVNHAPKSPRYGVLLCVNGTGILNSWLKHNATDGLDYDEMNKLAGSVEVGSDGLSILPYGNGAERTLENKNLGSSIHGLNFNIHTRAHLLRAAQEGIVFALAYGLGIMRKTGVAVKTVRAGNANMFLSPLFGEAFATVTGATIELYNTDGSQGAARGAGIGAGIYKGPKDAFVGLEPVRTIEPNKKLASAYQEAYKNWEDVLKNN
jgi:xylulokinase